MSIRPVFRKATLLVACDFTTRLTGLLARCMYTCYLDGEQQEPNLFTIARH